MNADHLILKRFEQLEDKMHDVEQTQWGDDFFEYVDREILDEWSTSVLNLLQRVFGEDSVHYQNFQSRYEHFEVKVSYFERCKGIFRAAKADFEGGYLFRVEDLVSAEVIDDFLDQANHLQEKGYKDPACVIAGVSLETTLKRLCDRHDISHGSMDRMNADLAKAGVYNVGRQKQVTAWADRRNDAAHGNWEEYSHADVADMIKGVERFIADYL